MLLRSLAKSSHCACVPRLVLVWARSSQTVVIGMAVALSASGCGNNDPELFELAEPEITAGFVQACADASLPEALSFVCEMEQPAGWFGSGCASVTSVLDSCTSNGQAYRQELCGRLISQDASAIAVQRRVDGSGRVDALLLRDAEFRFGRPFDDAMDQWQAEFEAAGCVASTRMTTFDDIIWQRFDCADWVGYVEVVSESADVVALWVGASRPGSVECLVNRDG